MWGIHRLRRASRSGYNAPSTDIPNTMIQRLIMPPIPVTVGGSNQKVFTLNASVTDPVLIWIGDEPDWLTRTVVYTWNATSNAILNSSGVEATDVDSVLGVWYMYLYCDAAGSETLIPSQTAPSYVETGFNAGLYGHPGTDRVRFYRYVGCHVCTTAATPAFLATKKYGHTYHFASISVASDATWTAADYTTRVPAIKGIKVAGFLSTGVVGTVSVSASSVDDQGAITVSAVGLGSNIIQAPFGPIDSTGDGKIYGKDTAQRGDVHISQYVDVV